MTEKEIRELEEYAQTIDTLKKISDKLK